MKTTPFGASSYVTATVSGWTRWLLLVLLSGHPYSSTAQVQHNDHWGCIHWFQVAPLLPRYIFLHHALLSTSGACHQHLRESPTPNNRIMYVPSDGIMKTLASLIKSWKRWHNKRCYKEATRARKVGISYMWCKSLIGIAGRFSMPSIYHQPWRP